LVSLRVGSDFSTRQDHVSQIVVYQVQTVRYQNGHRARKCQSIPEIKVLSSEYKTIKNPLTRVFLYTAISALINGCGSYPTISKSSIVKSSIFLTFGLIFSSGNRRISSARDNCSSMAFLWFI